MVTHSLAPAGRRGAAGLLALATVIASTTLGVATASSASAAEPVQVGLFGTQDPTYDGVFRQSLALLSYAAAGETPPKAAVSWLLSQQCPDGGFEAFRADPSSACTASDPVSFAGEDTNSTGIAAAALTAIGKAAAADKALTWVVGSQNADGGFPYFVGGTSDVNSTGISLLATSAAGRTPAQVAKGGASAADYLASMQLGCTAAATGGDGAFFADFAPGEANVLATVQGALGSSGQSLPFVGGPGTADQPRATCAAGATTTADPSPSVSAAAAAAPQAISFTVPQLAGGYLARLLAANGHAVPKNDPSTFAPVPGTVDVGQTAWAVLSLSAIEVGSTERDAALATLLAALGSGPGVAAAKAATATTTASDEVPGELALAGLAVVAAGGSDATVASLVTRLGATMRTAAVVSTPTPSATPTPTPTPTPSGTSNDGLAPSGASPVTPAIAGTGALLLLLGGLALGLSRRQGSWS